jgi:hypothetical protein
LILKELRWLDTAHDVDEFTQKPVSGKEKDEAYENETVTGDSDTSIETVELEGEGSAFTVEWTVGESSDSKESAVKEDVTDADDVESDDTSGDDKSPSEVKKQEKSGSSDKQRQIRLDLDI